MCVKKKNLVLGADETIESSNVRSKFQELFLDLNPSELMESFSVSFFPVLLLGDE